MKHKQTQGTMEDISTLTKFMTATQKAAYNDCAAGYYDKWYRYNHKDSGEAYQKAWLEAQNIFNPDFIQFIEYNN